MSVPTHERSESIQQFLQLSKELQLKTSTIVMNQNWVAKKYRIVWANRALTYAMNIFENVRRANILFPTSQEKLDQRINYLTIAYSDCEALLSQIDIAKTQFNIPYNTWIDWQALCTKTKRSINNRINGDIKIGVRSPSPKK